MSRYLVFIFFILELAFAQDEPKKFIAVMGGGGEPQGDNTIFDRSITELGNYLEKNPEWVSTVSFNGGHSKTEEIIKNGIGKNQKTLTPFTEEEYLKTIGSYIKKIETGEIKSGDQLLVWLDTHGAIASDNEKGHKVSVNGKASSDFTKLTGNKLVSTSQLQGLIDIANKKGIKLGIVDLSCHSGASIALANPQTCIVTSSGPKHFAYSNFPHYLISNLEKDKSLEDVFLDTMMDRNDTAFPMISSEIGKKVQNELYDLVGPYLKTYNKSAGLDKLTPYLEDQIKNDLCIQSDNNLKKIMDLSLEVEKITIDGRKKKNYEKFREAITNYSTFINGYRDSLTTLIKDESTKKIVRICESDEVDKKIPKPLCQIYTHKELAMINYDSEIQRLEKSLLSGDQSKNSFIQSSINLLKRAKEKFNELSTQNPNLKNYSDFMAKNPDMFSKTWGLAYKVTEELKNLYHDMYKDLASKDTSPNPCRDFKF
jgi:hypothetical protein